MALLSHKGVAFSEEWVPIPMEHSNEWMVKAIYVDDMDAVLSLWSEFIFYSTCTPKHCILHSAVFSTKSENFLNLMHEKIIVYIHKLISVKDNTICFSC